MGRNGIKYLAVAPHDGNVHGGALYKVEGAGFVRGKEGGLRDAVLVGEAWDGEDA